VIPGAVEEDMGDGFDDGKRRGGAEGAVGVDEGSVHRFGKAPLYRTGTGTT
jgi:hypothetical protein